MVQNKKATKEVDEVLPYLEGVAKNLVDRLYGPAGPTWGTKFTELEERRGTGTGGCLRGGRVVRTGQVYSADHCDAAGGRFAVALAGLRAAGSSSGADGGSAGRPPAVRL
jgi:hypothetical protein